MILFSLAPRAASAQVAQATPPWEVAAGYQSLDDPLDRVTLRGWMLDATLRLTPWLSAVGETGAAARTILDVEIRQFAVLGGARATARIGPFAEFVQLTAGIARSGSTVFGESSSDTAFALQPGGGVDIPLGRGSRFAARLQIDRRAILGGPFNTDDRHDVRLGGALVYASRR